MARGPVSRLGFRRALLSRRGPRSLALAAALTVVVGLTGCTTPAAGFNAQSQPTRSAEGGAITEYVDKGAAVPFSGPLLGGGKFVSTTFRGKVLVVNFWYASCPPCRAEAPMLRSVSTAYATRGVQFVGVNVRDEAGQASAFVREFKIPYPTILDANDASVQYAFSRSIPANAVPTTLIIDRQGRVSARILGQIEARSILTSLIDSALKVAS